MGRFSKKQKRKEFFGKVKMSEEPSKLTPHVISKEEKTWVTGEQKDIYRAGIFPKLDRWDVAGQKRRNARQMARKEISRQDITELQNPELLNTLSDGTRVMAIVEEDENGTKHYTMKAEPGGTKTEGKPLGQ